MVQVGIYTPYCCRVLRERGENDGLRRDPSEGSATGHWRGSDYKWLGWETTSLVFTAWSSPVLLPWWQHSSNGRESRLFGVEAIIPDSCIFDSYIKSQNMQGVPKLLSLSTPQIKQSKTTAKRKKDLWHASAIQTVPGTHEPMTHPHPPVTPFCTMLRFPRSSREKNRWRWKKGKNVFVMSLVAQISRSTFPK